jgi:hypothetical protein
MMKLEFEWTGEITTERQEDSVQRSNGPTQGETGLEWAIRPMQR